ncbi:hypothetical protein P9477_17775 [Enterobacter mori]|uniref:hypothetical protein n=1 Tax=Enterobacter mori TaxID=539813 RepID=UPI00398A965F
MKKLILSLAVLASCSANAATDYFAIADRFGVCAGLATFIFASAPANSVEEDNFYNKANHFKKVSYEKYTYAFNTGDQPTTGAAIEADDVLKGESNQVKAAYAVARSSDQIFEIWNDNNESMHSVDKAKAKFLDRCTD